jgi:hypothetical protein
MSAKIKRREFIMLLDGAAAAWPQGVLAQGKMGRLGYLSTANPRSVAFFRAFEERLSDFGYIDGQNIVIEYREAEGDVASLRDVTKLARLHRRRRGRREPFTVLRTSAARSREA